MAASPKMSEWLRLALATQYRSCNNCGWSQAVTRRAPKEKL